MKLIATITLKELMEQWAAELYKHGYVLVGKVQTVYSYDDHEIIDFTGLEVEIKSW